MHIISIYQTLGGMPLGCVDDLPSGDLLTLHPAPGDGVPVKSGSSHQHVLGRGG